jgi:hypothetical protein
MYSGWELWGARSPCAKRGFGTKVFEIFEDRLANGKTLIASFLDNGVKKQKLMGWKSGSDVGAIFRPFR